MRTDGFAQDTLPDLDRLSGVHHVEADLPREVVTLTMAEAFHALSTAARLLRPRIQHQLSPHTEKP